MKKVFFSLAIVAVAAIAFTSCNKKAESEKTAAPGDSVEGLVIEEETTEIAVDTISTPADSVASADSVPQK